MDSAADKTFFSARKWLEYAYRYARALRLSPYGLVGVMLARMSALTPPNVVAQLTPHDMPMTLNVNVALVGPTGSGKGRTMGQARHLMPSPPLCMLEEVKPKTGESIPAKFVAKVPATDGDGKPIKGEYMDKVMTDRCLLLMPEVVSLKAAMSRQGSIILPTLLESFSNEPLGDDTKGKQFQIKLPPYAYRLAAVVGVQPNNAGVLFDEAQTGLAGRFAYMPSVDTDAPSRRPEPPTGVFPYDPCRIPEGNGLDALAALLKYGSLDNMPQNGPDAREGYPLTIISFPSAATEYADHMQRLGVLGQATALDAHRVELVARFAALLALMDYRLEVSREDWDLSMLFMDVSDRIRAECMEQSRRSAVDVQAEQISVKRDAEEQADRSVAERAKTRLLDLLDTLDPAREGVPFKTLKLRLSKPQQRVCEDVLEDLYKGGLVDRREGPRGGDVYSLSLN